MDDKKIQRFKGILLLYIAAVYWLYMSYRLVSVPVEKSRLFFTEIDGVKVFFLFSGISCLVLILGGVLLFKSFAKKEKWLVLIYLLLSMISFFAVCNSVIVLFRGFRS